MGKHKPVYAHGCIKVKKPLLKLKNLPLRPSVFQTGACPANIMQTSTEKHIAWILQLMHVHYWISILSYFLTFVVVLLQYFTVTLKEHQKASGCPKCPCMPVPHWVCSLCAHLCLCVCVCVMWFCMHSRTLLWAELTGINPVSLLKHQGPWWGGGLWEEDKKCHEELSLFATWGAKNYFQGNCGAWRPRARLRKKKKATDRTDSSPTTSIHIRSLSCSHPAAVSLRPAQIDSTPVFRAGAA